MNRRSTALALVFTLLIALTGLRIAAQTDTAAIDPATKAKVQEKLQHISTELNLTDDQKTQLKPMLQSEVQELQAVKNDTSLSPDQKEAKAKAIHQSFKSQISNVLTPEQQKKWASMKAEAAEKY
jgi:Spy/CpxP family protein refolding chaperone